MSAIARIGMTFDLATPKNRLRLIRLLEGQGDLKRRGRNGKKVIQIDRPATTPGRGVSDTPHMRRRITRRCCAGKTSLQIPERGKTSFFGQGVYAQHIAKTL